MLLHAERSCAVVIDEQARLLPAMTGADVLVANTQRLLQAAQRLNVPVLASEQYPRGLGPTVPTVAPLLPSGSIVEKTQFSCVRNPAFANRLRQLGRSQVVLAGIESHVCVLQTALDLLQQHYAVFVAADATASRTRDSHERALARMARAGAEIVTTEMVVFEWLEDAGNPAFRELSLLVK